MASGSLGLSQGSAGMFRLKNPSFHRMRGDKGYSEKVPQEVLIYKRLQNSYKIISWP